MIFEKYTTSVEVMFLLNVQQHSGRTISTSNFRLDGDNK